MKAIILAAGMGTRLGKYTENLPKGMLNFNDKSLIQRQVDVLRDAGVTDISIITGYMGEKINIEGVKYYHNLDYENTNMVASLFCAEEELDDELLVCYGDIIYEKRVVEEVLKSNFKVGVVIDEDYLDYWKARLNDWEEDIESLVVDNGKIVELGKPCDLSKAEVRYVGLIKFDKEGVEVLKRLWDENKEKHWDSNEPFLSSKSFKKLYMTDMLQLIINDDVDVNPIPIKRGWLEFDTEEDYEKVNSWLESGKLNEFIQLGNEIIAIDGFSWVGKSTISKALANMLGYSYINTGSMFRAIAYKIREKNVESENDIIELAKNTNIDFRVVDGETKVFVDGEDFDEKLLDPELATLASKFSGISEIRDILLVKQRECSEKGNIVIEGRDTATIVFPDASWKFFLDADLKIKAERMAKVMKENGKNERPLQELMDEIAERDKADSTREVAPVKMAEDSIYYNNSLSPEGGEEFDAFMLFNYIKRGKDIIKNSEVLKGKI